MGLILLTADLKISKIVVSVHRRARVERHRRVGARRQRLRRDLGLNASEADFDDGARRQDVGHVSGDGIAVVGPEFPLLSGTFFAGPEVRFVRAVAAFG